MSGERVWVAAWRPDCAVSAKPDRRSLEPASGFAAVFALAGLGQAFDAMVFGLLAVTAFPEIFFTGPDRGVAAAASIALWALAYAVAMAARPLALALDRRWDSRARLAAARLVFVAASLVIAALPAGHQASPWLLVLARLGQGLGLAGLAHRPLAPPIGSAEDHRGRRHGWALAAGLALVAALCVLGLLAWALQRPDFLGWGWRYPFVMALAVNAVAFFGDLNIERMRRPHRPEGRPALRLVTASDGPGRDAPC